MRCVKESCEGRDAGDQNYPGLCPTHAWQRWLAQLALPDDVLDRVDGKGRHE